MINTIYKRKIIFILLGLIFVFFLTFAFYSFSFSQENKIYYRVYAADKLLSGKNFEATKEVIDQQTQNYLNKKLIFIYKDKYLEIPIARLIKYFDCEKMARASHQKGRESRFLVNQKTRLVLLIRGEHIPLEFILNENSVKEIIEKLKSELNVPFREAFVQIKEGKVLISPALTGEVLDEDLLWAEIKEKLVHWADGSIDVPMKKIYSTVSEEELARVKKETEDILSAPLILQYGSFTYLLDKFEFSGWLSFKLKPWDWQKLTKEEQLKLNNYLIEISGFDPSWGPNAKIRISLDKGKIRDYLKNFAQKYIDIKPVNALLGIKEGQVVVVQREINGRKLDIEETISQIEDALLKNQLHKIVLKVDEELAEVRADNYQTLGIKALIGSGYSDFAGSPPNRVHNITLGASKVNGALIKPGESFSLNRAIGPVDASSGFLPELVIKENKTVPEYGGGLCQIGTTCFRAALNSGLPILERRNHAYIVSYYAPVGTDATIYPPHPDVIFLNDTEGYILIQTRIEGTRLIFDFYGTPTGKSVKFNGIDNLENAVERVENVSPYIYNQKADGSAEAEFYRFIFKDNQLIKTERFHSAYDSPSKYPH